MNYPIPSPSLDGIRPLLYIRYTRHHNPWLVYSLPHFETISLFSRSYGISAISFRGNYSFLNLALCTVTKVRKLFKGGNYSRAKTIRVNTVCMLKEHPCIT